MTSTNVGNAKFQIISNDQIPRKEANRSSGHLEIGVWDLFGIWILGFGILGGPMGLVSSHGNRMKVKEEMV